MNEVGCGIPFTSRKEEVNRGLTEEQALTEAKRCLDCANPGCMEGCPVGIDIPRFIKNIERGEFLEAAKTLKETSALPAVCGRVCPQEKQCESKCIHLKDERKAGCHRLSGTLCCRLRAGKRTNLRTGNQRKERH